MYTHLLRRSRRLQKESTWCLLQLALDPPNYATTVQSWLRQRAYALWAVQELGEAGGCWLPGWCMQMVPKQTIERACVRACHSFVQGSVVSAQLRGAPQGRAKRG